jgi:hypothetical protein
MKLEATIVVSYRADSLAEAGDKLDDMLRRAREREDVEVESIELRTPATAGPVSLPRVPSPPPPPAKVPHPLPDGRG